jgi:hypothetical protein
MTTVVPGTQIYLMLELFHGRKLISWLVRTRHLKKDITHYCYCHLIPDSGFGMMVILWTDKLAVGLGADAPPVKESWRLLPLRFLGA